MSIVDEESTEVPRPRYHFTPPTGWMNDPNGLVHHDGAFHLFYQHNPYAPEFGEMHWGHAVSDDLLHWQDRPIALAPDSRGLIYSGSAVIDRHGTAGHGQGAMILAFTHHSEAGESQSLAVADGERFVILADNPVLAAPEGQADFRDPKVFWFGDDRGHWIMVLAVGRGVWLYRSIDLRTWSRCSRMGLVDSMVETPDLFPLGDRWVLTYGRWTGGPDGGSGTEYLVGDFDGETFVPVTGRRTLDHGADFYACQSWSNHPESLRMCIAWMSNVSYAGQVPSSGWRGALTTPRRFELSGTDMVQQPLEAVSLLRSAGQTMGPTALRAGVHRLLESAPLAYDIEVDVEVGAGSSFRLTLGSGVTVEWRGDQVAVDRSNTGTFGRARGGRRLAPAPAIDGRVVMRVLVDATSVEVFAQGGTCVVTEQVFADRVSGPVDLVVASRGIGVTTLGLWGLEQAIRRDPTRR